MNARKRTLWENAETFLDRHPPDVLSRSHLAWHRGTEFVSHASSAERDHPRDTNIKALYMRRWTKARRERKKRRSTWRGEVSGLEGLTLYYEVGFKVEVFQPVIQTERHFFCALWFLQGTSTRSLSFSRLYNFSLINFIYCDARIKSSITINTNSVNTSDGELCSCAKL